MSDNTVSPDTDNLDDFEALFSGKATAPVATEDEPKEVEVKEDDSEVESLATDETETEAEVDEPTDEKDEDVKPKKKTSQERFNEMTAARRAAEREAEAERVARQLLEKRLEELEARLTSNDKEEPKAPVVTDGPDPDDVNEDGSAKYPLGEYDPKYIRALVKYENDIERASSKAAEAQEFERRQAETAVAALNEQWQGKLAAVEENIPDIRSKASALDESFGNIDPNYGKYLATTIMTMDHGPEVLNYLADNINEAKAIASLGAVGATIALGELHSQFKSKPISKPKVTSAPEPPETRVRGHSGRFQVTGDTDDLTAFESIFYGK